MEPAKGVYGQQRAIPGEKALEERNEPLLPADQGEESLGWKGCCAGAGLLKDCGIREKGCIG
jgi:hypothetical protein